MKYRFNEVTVHLCRCARVTKEVIQNSINNGKITLLDIHNDCGASGYCGACHNEIRNMIAETTNEQ